MILYVEFHTNGQMFKVDAETSEEAIQKARQMAIDIIDEDIKNNGVFINYPLPI